MKVLVNKKRTYIYSTILSVFLLLVGFAVYAIASGNTFYKLAAGTNQVRSGVTPGTFYLVSDSTIAEHGKSRIFGTNTCPQDIFVPSKTTGEWESFIYNKPACVLTTNTPMWRDGTFTGATLNSMDCWRYNTTNGSYVQSTTVAQLVTYYNSCVTPSQPSEPPGYTVYCRNTALNSSNRTLVYITWHRNGSWGCNMLPGTTMPIRLISL